MASKKSKPKKKAIVLDVEGQEVRVSSPDKVYFPELGITKLELIEYYLAVAPGVLRNIHRRPIVLKRYVNGIHRDWFFQKRAPKNVPEFIETVTLRFPSGRTADEIVVTQPSQLVWMTNLGNIDLNPHPVRADDLDHPDELRVDLDPGPGVEWDSVRKVALVVRGVLDDFGLVGFPKTSGSRGIHINVRIERKWSFTEVRRAAVTLAREVERRAPAIATSRWWKEERHGVFVDYNQNAKDRTVCSAYSVRPVPEARVSAPLRWDEVPEVDADAFTLRTMPARFSELGDLSEGIDEAVGSIAGLLEEADRQEASGKDDAPWPPHYPKQPGEPARVQPSRKKKSPAKKSTADESTEEKKTGTGRRVSKMPLITVSKAKKKEEAMAGLDRWKARHPDAAKHLTVEDVLVDAMRGRSTTWTRIRLNLRNVPEELRPAKEKPDPDYNPWAAFKKKSSD